MTVVSQFAKGVFCSTLLPLLLPVHTPSLESTRWEQRSLWAVISVTQEAITGVLSSTLYILPSNNTARANSSSPFHTNFHIWGLALGRNERTKKRIVVLSFNKYFSYVAKTAKCGSQEMKSTLKHPWHTPSLHFDLIRFESSKAVCAAFKPKLA